MMSHYVFDVLVVGAGLAGERAAIEIASSGLSVAMLSLVPPRQSHSNAAQGGIQASLCNTVEGKEDSWEIHFKDTVKGSDWGADQHVVEKVCKIAPKLVRELDYWGAPFSRTSDGRINQRNFGGTSKPRCAFASDGVGHILLNTLDSQAIALNIPIFSRYQMLSLIQDGHSVMGVIALNIVTGEIKEFLSPVVILATGGAGQLFRDTTNARISYGDGQAIALETGLVPLGNPESIQFHPTAIVPGSILVTEGCRGDGGVLLDKNEKEFMWDYSSTKGNLASRDVVSRSMMIHIKKGFGVDSPYEPHLWLDIKRLGKKHIKERLSDVDFICRTFIGVNPIEEYIPVRPAQHYTMFGIKTDENCCAYGLDGLFAIGECACWDMHGFNRLGGNSLLETVASGYFAGRFIVENRHNQSTSFRNFSVGLVKDELRKQKERIDKLIESRGQWNVNYILQQVKGILAEKAGIFRNEEDLTSALIDISCLYKKAKNTGLFCKCIGPNLELLLALRLPGMLKMAHCVVKSALMRTESRGSHFREDFPERNDKDWLKRTLAYYPKNSESPVIEYETIKTDLFPPGDRGYGEKK